MRVEPELVQRSVGIQGVTAASLTRTPPTARSAVSTSLHPTSETAPFLRCNRLTDSTVGMEINLLFKKAPEIQAYSSQCTQGATEAVTKTRFHEQGRIIHNRL